MVGPRTRLQHQQAITAENARLLRTINSCIAVLEERFGDTHGLAGDEDGPADDRLFHYVRRVARREGEGGNEDVNRQANARQFPDLDQAGEVIEREPREMLRMDEDVPPAVNEQMAVVEGPGDRLPEAVRRETKMALIFRRACARDLLGLTLTRDFVLPHHEISNRASQIIKIGGDVLRGGRAETTNGSLGIGHRPTTTIGDNGMLLYTLSDNKHQELDPNLEEMTIVVRSAGNEMKIFLPKISANDLVDIDWKKKEDHYEMLIVSLHADVEIRFCMQGARIRAKDVISEQVISAHLICPTSYTAYLPQNVAVRCAVLPTLGEDTVLVVQGLYKGISFKAERILEEVSGDQPN